MPDDPHELAVALRKAAHALIEADPVRDLDRTVGDLVRAAVTTVPGATCGGISRLQDGRVRSSHATDDLISKLDGIQTELEQGPCITAAEEPPADGIVHATDLGGRIDSDRWPVFAPQAAQLGFRSLLAVGLWTGHRRYAALNLYAMTPDAFGTESRLLAALFGAQAATLLYGAESAAGLDEALASRDAIGQAKGILMERFGLGADKAFDQLVAASQDTNLKLTAVAGWVVEQAEHRGAGQAGEAGEAAPGTAPAELREHLSGGGSGGVARRADAPTRSGRRGSSAS